MRAAISSSSFSRGVSSMARTKGSISGRSITIFGSALASASDTAGSSERNARPAPNAAEDCMNERRSGEEDIGSLREKWLGDQRRLYRARNAYASREA